MDEPNNISQALSRFPTELSDQKIENAGGSVERLDSD